MKHTITKKDIGKLFKRTERYGGPGYIIHDGPNYMRIIDFNELTDMYICDIKMPGWKEVTLGAGQTNIPSIYCYEEVSELEVLIVCGVVM